MNKTPINISASQNQPRLSKAQQTFNKLIKQIEQARATLADWEAFQAPYRNKFSTQLQPLLKDAEDLQIKIVHALDNASGRSGFSKRERTDIADLITDMLQGLLQTRDDDALKAIFNKHSNISYSEVNAEGQAEAKSMLNDLFGIDMGDEVDLRSPESVLEHAQAQQEAARQAREEREARRKKSPKQLAKEAQQETDEQQLRQSIREIYRKLASALHPDREPDPQERTRKTALMQRVNQAYDKNNLLQLLELQIELEQIDQAAINNVSDERLKHYNQILREQFQELRHEIMRVECAFMDQARLDPFATLTPKTVMKALITEIAAAQRDIRQLKKDLLAFEAVHTLKAWIKHSRMQSQRDARYDFPF